VVEVLAWATDFLVFLGQQSPGRVAALAALLLA